MRLTWDGLVVGRLVIPLELLILVAVIFVVVLMTSAWWKALLALALIPLLLGASWSERKMGARTCPTCGGSGRIWKGTHEVSKRDPNWVISPSETLRNWMEENGFVLGERLLVKPLATACSTEPETLQRILDGKPVDQVTACKLELGTDIPARLWLNLERAFRQGLAEGKTWVRP